MALADTIRSVEENVGKVWDKIEEVGGAVPAEKNIENMPDSIKNAVDNIEYGQYKTVVKTIAGGVITSLAGQTQNGKIPYWTGGTRNSQDVNIPTGIFSSVSTEYQESVELSKSHIMELYIDYSGSKVNDQTQSYIFGSDVTGNSPFFGAYSAVDKAKFIGLKNTGTYGLAGFGGQSKDGTIEFDNTLTDIGDNFMYMSQYRGTIYLPDSIENIGDFFFYRIYGDMTVYVPQNAPLPPSNSFYAYSSTVNAYVNGVTLKGPGAKAWKEALPNYTSSIYRKLILDPEWA